MLSRRDQPFPREQVRDVLGICRALYRAERASAHPSPVRLQRLARIGDDLRVALELAEAGPDTVGHRAAWQRAEDAVRALGAEQSITEPLLPVVVAAVGAVRRAG